MINNNYCVIMAGGIGSRFWPFSRNDRPKQFLDFFGTGRSLLQMTVDRFRPIVPIENVLIVTNVAYRDLILEQIPDISSSQILCEPCRRNTAPCIAYAMSRIQALTDNANIVVAASDHLITNEPEFLRIITEGLNYVAGHDSLLTLGMRPTRPETGYGYIQFETPQTGNESNILVVKTFTEKPNRELAEVFVRSGEFLWNSGMFLWNLQAVMKALHQYLPLVMEQFDQGADIFGTPAEETFIQEHFPLCPNISIDYGVMEKASNVMVMAADFGWSDLGTWGSLYDLSDKDPQGNVSLHSEALFYDSQSNIVTLESGKLAVIEGLDDYIVAENQGVLLICRKQNEQQIRQMVNDVQVNFDGKYN
ncbi:MAG: mannose-1-phosphate guanylyltransferase [Paludibacteraceae bacterium]|nr:mannose-1-phosphate guanylyltransferase [Paludibacteraceae bacterium]